MDPHEGQRAGVGAAFLVIAPNVKRPQCPSAGEWEGDTDRLSPHGDDLEITTEAKEAAEQTQLCDPFLRRGRPRRLILSDGPPPRGLLGAGDGVWSKLRGTRMRSISAVVTAAGCRCGGARRGVHVGREQPLCSSVTPQRNLLWHGDPPAPRTPQHGCAHAAAGCTAPRLAPPRGADRVHVPLGSPPPAGRLSALPSLTETAAKWALPSENP